MDDESLLYASQISKKCLEVCKSIDIIIYDKCNRRILSFVIILTRELLLRIAWSFEEVIKSRIFFEFLVYNHCILFFWETKSIYFLQESNIHNDTISYINFIHIICMRIRILFSFCISCCANIWINVQLLEFLAIVMESVKFQTSSKKISILLFFNIIIITMMRRN